MLWWSLTRGGGKSFAVDALCMIYCKMFPGIQILLVRRTYKDVFKNHVITLQQKLHCALDNDPKRAAKWSKDEGAFVFSDIYCNCYGKDAILPIGLYLLVFYY